MIGEILGDRYELIEIIGEGGMAIVYKSKDKKLNRLVAVKVLKKEFSSILNKFIFNISLSNEELKSEVEDDLNHFSYFYIIPKNMIGDTENDLYSLNKGFNYEPISTNFF